MPLRSPRPHPQPAAAAVDAGVSSTPPGSPDGNGPYRPTPRRRSRWATPRIRWRASRGCSLRCSSVWIVSSRRRGADMGGRGAGGGQGSDQDMRQRRGWSAGRQRCGVARRRSGHHRQCRAQRAQGPRGGEHHHLPGGQLDQRARRARRIQVRRPGRGGGSHREWSLGLKRKGAAMNGDGRPRNRRQRRGGPACDGAGPGRGRRKASARGSESSLSGRTATRALVAVGAYVAQDVRDAEGLTRPMLRRAALRLALCGSAPARRLGSAYLRLDPPAPDDVRPRGDAIAARKSSSPYRALLAPPVTTDPGADGQTPAC
jgi:hypothetical protein